MDAKMKLTLFKLFHICIVSHSPGGPIPAVNEICLPPFEQSEISNQHFRSIFHIIEIEVSSLRKTADHSNTNPSLCEILMQLAVRACALVSRVTYYENSIQYSLLIICN